MDIFKNLISEDLPERESFMEMRRRTLKEAVDSDARPGYLIALLAAYLGARGGELPFNHPEAQLLHTVGGKLTTLNEKVYKLQEVYDLQS